MGVISNVNRVAAVIPLLIGCALIFPQKYEYSIRLVPRADQGGTHRIGGDGVLSYEAEGLRIDVEHMTDRELNSRFPAESSQGRYSSNPYTYGNYTDPGVGYVRNRFTVFRVTVKNTNHAKVELPPLRTLVTTNRKGEVLEPYGVLAGSARSNFESYYRTRRGPSGNEYYRFNTRMGIVRTKNYLNDEKIFKGEDYGGFIVFAPLDDEVERITFHVRDFVLKFNAFDKPLETVDLAFQFDRQTTIKTWEREEWLAAAEQVSRARLSAPSDVRGNVTGDITRDVTAIDAFAKTRLPDLNRCFEQEFIAGKASEGEVSVRLTILSSGLVEAAEIVSSSVVSSDTDECVQGTIQQWRFKSSTGATRSDADSLTTAPQPPSTAKVTATCYLEFIDMRLE
jgi:TonB family protein